MTELAAPLARILLRYVGAVLVAKAGLQVDDPDLIIVTEAVIGGLCALIAEGWYALARKRGWHQ